MAHWRTMHKPSDTLKAYDLIDPAVGKPRDFTVEIVKVQQGKVFSPDSNKTDPMPFLYFRGVSKPFGANVTNCKTIASIVGSPNTDRWVGHKITLYATMVRGKSGEKVEGIRIRPKAATGAAEGIPDREPDHEVLERQERAAREPGEEG